MKYAIAAILGISIILILLIGCSSGEDSTSNESLVGIEGNINPDNESLDNTICTEQWKCLNHETKIFQLANCSFSQKLDCPLGCFNDTCKVGKICETGFKCIDEEKYGFQLASCSWDSITTCEFGCLNSTCNEEPENASIQEIEVIEEQIIQQTIATTTTMLETGEIHEVSVNGNIYNLSIYTIDIGKVQLKINNQKTGWIEVNDNYTYHEDRFFIEEILFQPYEGGIRAIGYRVE